MAIEYVVSAGPGTLIDYGVALEIQHNDSSVDLIELDHGPRWLFDEAKKFGFDPQEVVVVSRPCIDACPTGR